MRTFTNAPLFGVDDFPLLLQPESASAPTSEINASVQNGAFLCMAEPQPPDSGGHYGTLGESPGSGLSIPHAITKESCLMHCRIRSSWFAEGWPTPIAR